jgi:hypothetical protein
MFKVGEYRKIRLFHDSFPTSLALKNSHIFGSLDRGDPENPKLDTLHVLKAKYDYLMPPSRDGNCDVLKTI